MSSSGLCKLSKKYYPSLDEHHTIPREFGGENSYTIFLGPDIHQLLHRSVGNMKIRDEFLSSLPADTRRMASDLISLIEQAKASFGGEEKLIKKFEVEITIETFNKLNIVAKEKGFHSVKQFVISMLKEITKTA